MQKLSRKQLQQRRLFLEQLEARRVLAAFDLLGYEQHFSNTNLPEPTGHVDYSGVAYDELSNSFLIISNGANAGNGAIHEYEYEEDVSNNLVLVHERAIALSNFDNTGTGLNEGDPEAITWMGGDKFAFVRERVGLMHEFWLDVDGPIDGNSTVDGDTNADGLTDVISATGGSITTITPNPNPAQNDNASMEGIAYDDDRNVFYIIKESSWLNLDGVNGTEIIYQVAPTGTVTPIHVAGLTTELASRDVSDIFYANNHIFLLTEAGTNQITRITFDPGTSTWVFDDDSNDTIVAPGGQPEGLTFSSDGFDMIVVSEPRQIFHFRNYTSFTPNASPDMLEDGTDDGSSLTDNATSDTTPTFTGTLTRTVGGNTVPLDKANVFLLVDGVATGATVETDNNGNYSITPTTALPLGEHDISIRVGESSATAAANQSFASAELAIVIHDPVTFSSTNGVLTIEGSDFGDVITVTVATNVLVNGQDTGLLPANVSGFVINAGGGNDIVDLSAVSTASGFTHASLPGNVVINGGGGDDVITGSDLDDVIVGGEEPHPGILDETFSADGISITDFGFGSSSVVHDIAVDSNGKLVAVGYAYNGGAEGDFAVARYNLDGSADTSFSGDGVVSLSLGSYEMGKGVAVQSDGKILVAGHTKTYTGDADFALARFNADGTLDTSFGTSGSVTTNFAGGTDEAVAIVIQSDGKIVLAGGSGGNLAMVRYNSNGTLDTSFDSDGKVTASISSFYNDRLHIGLQSDGKIVVAGGNANMLVARFTTSGSLDTSYGTSGVATVDFGGTEVGRGIAIDSSGRAVVAGETWDASGRDFAVARLTTSGALDTTFDSDGKVRTDFPENGQDAAYDVAIDSVGRIVVMGFAAGVHNSDFAVARYNSDGSLDRSFGDVGLVVTEVVVDGDYPNGMALNGNNDIFLAGYVFDGFVGTDFGIVKYLGGVESDNDELYGEGGDDEIFGGPGHDLIIGGEGPHAGILDATFDDDGILITDFGFGSSSVAHDIAVDANGKLVAVGYAYNGAAQGDLALARYNLDGSADTSFSSDGVASLDLGTYEMGKAVAIQSDGKILVAGHTKTTTGDSDFALARFNSDGSLDTSFGTNGSVTTNFSGGRDEAVAIVIQSDGKIVLAGGSGSNLALVRYNANGTLDTSFDTDGKVSVSISNFVEPYNEVRLNLALQSDGKIVVVGGLANIHVARFTTSGSLDTSYGTSGVATVDFGGTEVGRGIAIDSSGRAVVAGETWDASGRDFAVARLTTSGALDTTFDSDGKVRTDFPENGQDAAYDVAIDGGGRIVVTGFAAGPNSSDFAVARYNSNGSLDNSFGDAGLVVTEVVVDGDYPNAMALNSNSDIFVAGYVFEGSIGTEFGIAKYTGVVPSDDDVLDGGSGDDELIGGPGDDTLEGGAGDDVLDGGFNQDTFVFAGLASLGHDIVRGSAGIDTLDFSALGAGITLDLDVTTTQTVAADLLELTLPDLDLENVIGTALADSIRGTAANNTLAGGAGNDMLYGHGGFDTLNGGGGNDSYLFDSQSSGTAYVQENASVDTDTFDFSTFGVGVSANLSSVTQQTLGGGLALVLSTSTGIENVTGTAYADTIIGNGRNNALTGGAGNDNLYGYGGSDTIHGDAGTDYIRGGDQPDQLYGDADADTAYGDLDDGYGDAIYGGDGNDLLYGDQGLGGYGYGGPDQIQGNAGADTAYGEAANDSLYGGTENDTLNGDEGADSIFGEDGNDTMYGDNGYPSGYSNDDVLTGGSGDDYGYGGYGYDSLYGNDGNDNLDGGYGNDTLRGDAGNDTLTGGYGSDNYIFDTNASGSDTVNESSNMDTDALDFSAFLTGISLSLNSTSSQYLGGSLTLTLSSNTGIENVYGTAFNDSIFGNSRNNLLKGNDGNDWMYGGYGDDTMYGGNGDDHMYGEAGVDYLFGELGADDLWGGDGTDSLNAGGNPGDQEHQ